MKEKVITVGIVEDDAGIRQSLEWLLKSSAKFLCVAACRSAEEALRVLPKAAPEVILMDINLPEMSGIECTARMKELLPEVQVVMITVYDDADRVFNALRAGASGYILKRAAPEKILQAIREVHAGGVPMSSEIARKVLGTFREPAPAPAAAEDNLSRREQEVLELLSQGCANKEIADKLSISIETVTWHLRHIYTKLHVRSRTQAALKYLSQRKNP
ncbi:MAG TPA: response regulator transcription factor [Verrucomicrobiae bacterium]|nr:response regulator transcription factor [Verrucomicrobiae bacterium]